MVLSGIVPLQVLTTTALTADSASQIPLISLLSIPCPPQAPSALLWPLPQSSLGSLPLVFSYVTRPPLVAARIIFLKHKLDPVTFQLNPFSLPVAGNSRPLGHSCTQALLFSPLFVSLGLGLGSPSSTPFPVHSNPIPFSFETPSQRSLPLEDSPDPQSWVGCFHPVPTASWASLSLSLSGCLLSPSVQPLTPPFISLD